MTKEKNNTLVKINPEEYGLNKDKVKDIEKAFLPKIVERNGLVAIYEQILIAEITPELSDNAKSVRLKLVKVRTGIAEVHKTQKTYFRSAGLFVDAWKNKETLPVTQMEEKLFEIEDYYNKIDRDKLDEVEKDRINTLQYYEVETEHYDLRNMTLNGFDQLLKSSKIAYDLRVEEEKKTEQERIAKEKAAAEEQERIKKENETLKKDAEERGRIAKIEIDKQAKIEIQRKANEEKERATYEAKLKKERDEKEKIKSELKQKQDAEEKTRRETEAKIRAEKEAKEKIEREEKLAPDKKKLERLAIIVQEIQMPSVTSKEAKNILTQVVELLNKTSNFIKQKSLDL